MAGTAGTGGLSALTIGGISAAAVVAGGVAAYFFGFSGAEDPVPPQTRPAAEAPANGNSAPQTQSADSTGAAAPEAEAETEAAPEAPASGTQTAATDGAAEDQPTEAADPQAEAPGDDQAAAQTETQAEEEAGSGEPAAEAPAETAQETDASGTEGAQSETAEAPAETAAETPAETAEQSAAEPAETAGASADSAAEPADSFVLVAPQLDTVRFEPDGNGLVAGRAQAGVDVAILLDGEVLDSFTVEAGGEFAAFVTAPPSESQRVLSLMASHGDQQVASDASFILGATRIPVAVAEAETAGSEDEAQPEPAETAPASGEAETVGAAEESSENAGTAVAEAEADAARSEEETAQLEAPQTGIAQDETAEVETALAETAQTEAEVSEAPKAEEETPEPVTEAPQSVAVLRADSSGITVVQPGASGAADGVALDTLSYTDAGNVEIAGRARAGAALRIYVDNAAAGDLRSGADGSWTASLGAVAPGSYTLRVDEVDAQGSVVSRIETPFTREAPEVLAEAAPEADPEVPEPVLRAITVRKGDSLWAISRAAYGDGRLYVRLFDANRNEIKDPDLIYPGQVFALPE